MTVAPTTFDGARIFKLIRPRRLFDNPIGFETTNVLEKPVSCRGTGNYSCGGSGGCEGGGGGSGEKTWVFGAECEDHCLWYDSPHIYNNGWDLGFWGGGAEFRVIYRQQGPRDRSYDVTGLTT